MLILSLRKSWISLDQSSTATPKRNIRSKVLLCIWWDMKNVVYYKLLKPNQIVTAEYYQQQLIDLNHALNQKCPIIVQRKRKVILLHDNTRSHVAKIVKDTLSTSMGSLITCRVFIRLCFFRLSFISINAAQPWPELQNI